MCTYDDSVEPLGYLGRYVCMGMECVEGLRLRRSPIQALATRHSALGTLPRTSYGPWAASRYYLIPLPPRPDVVATIIPSRISICTAAVVFHVNDTRSATKSLLPQVPKAGSRVFILVSLQIIEHEIV